MIEIDKDRHKRQGFPEVIYAEGKTEKQLGLIFEGYVKDKRPLLVTRVKENHWPFIENTFESKKICIDKVSKSFYWYPPRHKQKKLMKYVNVISAGSSDLPVVGEIQMTLNFLGVPNEYLADVGVAGIHRILDKRSKLNKADVNIVVAGMDGALPSVVGGLVGSPVIAVPTSVGYGASFQGVSALLAMLNSCANGIMVTNIDNGFGAAMAAYRIVNDKK